MRDRVVGGRLVEVVLREPDGAVRPLSAFGAGVGPWDRRLGTTACAHLLNARWELRADGTFVEQLAKELLCRAAAEESFKGVAHAIWPQRLDQVFLVDEPEAYLQPGAVERRRLAAGPRPAHQRRHGGHPPPGVPT